MDVELIEPAELKPNTSGLVTHVVVARAEQLVFVAGQVALNRAGEIVGPGDHAAQARQVWSNLKHCLNAAGVPTGNVVNYKIYVVGHQPGLCGSILRIGQEVMGSLWPVAAAVYVSVVALAQPEFLVEIEAIATRSAAMPVRGSA